MAKGVRSSDSIPFQIIPLGGVGEIGNNMFLVSYDDEILVLDAGLMFPEDEMLGIDIVIPDSSYLLANKEKIKGIIITHGHEDHTGALPYILPKLQNVPIYGTRLTLGLIEYKLEEHNLLSFAKLNTITAGQEIQLGSFKLRFFRTNHSIPDSVGVAIFTPAGNIVYTSDFKFDQTPVHGKLTDYHELVRLGKRGVLVALSDSTNAERPGFTPSEKEVGAVLKNIFAQEKGRIIVATFASNIHRIQQVVDAAAATGRKLAIEGYSMANVTDIATRLGYLNITPGVMVELEEIKRMPPSKVVLLTTGSQGEPMAALSRIANASHRKVEIIPGDTVVFAANPIPGNEKLVARTINQLFKRGANVIYEQLSGAHVSGHGSQEELKFMLNLLQPKYLIPVHGEYRHLICHARLAEQVGIPKENIFVVENGSVIEFKKGKGAVVGSVNAGKVFVDGLRVGDVGSIVLRDRQILSQHGIFVIILGVSKSEGSLAFEPEILTRGFVYVKESEDLLDETKELLKQVISKTLHKSNDNWSYLKGQIKDATSKFLWEKTGRRPMILPIIMEIDN
ncbi:MAG: ribonuclease J [Firmicutes bacterium]|nr:ribonuclease J [Bacillota bacterium]